MTELYVFGGIIALIVFDRLFMPPLNAYGRRPLVEVWVGYAQCYVNSVHAAYLANQLMKEQTRQQAAALLTKEAASDKVV